MVLGIKLKRKERAFLEEFVKKGTKKARAIKRANVLLLADDDYGREDISKIVNIHERSVSRIKKRYLVEGLKYVIEEKPRPGQPKKYNEKEKAEIIALACTSPPKGRKKWTVRLLAEETKKMAGLKNVNRESIRLVLKKAKLNLG